MAVKIYKKARKAKKKRVLPYIQYSRRRIARRTRMLSIYNNYELPKKYLPKSFFKIDLAGDPELIKYFSKPRVWSVKVAEEFYTITLTHKSSVVDVVINEEDYENSKQCRKLGDSLASYFMRDYNNRIDAIILGMDQKSPPKTIKADGMKIYPLEKLWVKYLASNS